jgi:hypothetical protein
MKKVRPEIEFPAGLEMLKYGISRTEIMIVIPDTVIDQLNKNKQFLKTEQEKNK